MMKMRGNKCRLAAIPSPISIHTILRKHTQPFVDLLFAEPAAQTHRNLTDVAQIQDFYS